MQNSFFPSFDRIKQKERPNVNSRVFYLNILVPVAFSLLILGHNFSQICHADDAPTDSDSSSNFNDETLPDIRAATFDLKVIRRSTSNKVYLLESASNSMPKTGRILLLKRESVPFMAFRVLKTYPENRQVAAKRIKRYGNHRFLEPDQVFLAIEKISEFAPPAPTVQDKEDIQELEKKEGLKVSAFDPDLDSSTSPSSNKDGDKEDPSIKTDEEKDGEDSHLAVTIEEPQILDHNHHWLTAGFGFVRNAGPPATGGSYYFAAGNIRYGLTLGRIVFFDQPRLQDSIAIEVGAYLYKALNFATQGDAYTLTSGVATLRYNINFSESFGIFFYGGVMMGYVFTSSQGQSSVISSLNSLGPAAGGGVIFQLGPNWYARVDLGLDALGLNLLLRF